MFYDKVKSLCDEKGISMTQLTSELDCSQSNVTRWKAGAAPRPKLVKAVADYFNVEVSYFSENYHSHSINHSVVTTDSGMHSRALSEIETELLKICEKLDTRQKTELLSFAYELEKTKPDER